jgi:hypothetical protein
MANDKEGKIFRPGLDGSSPNYWQQQREGFKRINEYREALVLAEQEKTLALYEKTDPKLDAVASHPGAVRILKAWGIIVQRPNWESQPVILNKSGSYAKASEIPVFGKGKKPK